MKTARRIVQLLFLALFCILTALTIGRVDWSGDGGLQIASPLPVDFFLLTDPLAALTAMLASRSFLPALVFWSLPAVILTLLAGRAYCGWVCPLGTCIDAADRVARPRQDRRTTKEKCWPQLKYYVLAGMLVTAALGKQAVWLFDPQPLLLRSVTLAVFGPVQWLVRLAEGIPGLGAAARRLGAPVFPEQQMTFQAGLAVLVVFAAVLAGGLLSRRFWCRTLCPLGAFLGLLARVPLLRRRVTPACGGCTVCELDCKMDAIGRKGAANDSAECIYCYNCVSACQKQAAVFGVKQPEEVVPLDLSRRRLLAGAGLGALWGLVGQVTLAARPLRDGSANVTSTALVRPPGAVREELFTERCIRCGACMKVCPTNGLQPSVTEAGVFGLWTPVLKPRVGECTQKCDLCGQVCPTEAILPFRIAEKEHIYIGRAVIDRSRCVVWESGRQCLVCDEVCSYDAIYWKREGGVKRPFVDAVRCVGCGICENNCPVGGSHAAIYVTAEGDKRRLSREQQRRWRAENLVKREER